MTTIKVRADYYQQFDADYNLDVPAEGYGGWKKEEIEVSLEHSAVVFMHAWDCRTREEFPGWWRAVEYNPRAVKILKTVFPKLLSALRRYSVKIFHVVGERDYYSHYPGYQRVAKLTPPQPPPEKIKADAVLEKLRIFRKDHVFPGRENKADFKRGLGTIDFAPQAKPRGDEPIARDSTQLFALCKQEGVNHLIYAGFAIDWCLLMMPGNMNEMNRHGIMCSVFRQAVTAVENKETARRELCKEIGLWRTSIAYGFVFDVNDFITSIEGQCDPKK